MMGSRAQWHGEWSPICGGWGEGAAVAGAVVVVVVGVVGVVVVAVGP